VTTYGSLGAYGTNPPTAGLCGRHCRPL